MGIVSVEEEDGQVFGFVGEGFDIKEVLKLILMLNLNTIEAHILPKLCKLIKTLK